MTLEASDPNDLDRRHHRWAALLGFTLIANSAVLTLGTRHPAASYLGVAVALSLLLLALGGISISIIFPPEHSHEGMAREYTLLVSVEMLTFVLCYGVAAYGLVSWTALRGAHAETIGIGLVLLLWLALQLRLLFVAARESTGQWPAALQIVLGTIAGTAGWLVFNAAAFRCFGVSMEPITPGRYPDVRLFLNLIGLTPAAGFLSFVMAATYAPRPPGLALWARASTAYIATLPTLAALVLLVMILGL